MEFKFIGTLYKGMRSQNFDMNRSMLTWFGLEKETATKYGSLLYKITIKNEIKLIDITSWEFRNDFFQKLNRIIGPQALIDVSLRRKKALALMALGLPNLQVQMLLMQEYLKNIPQQYNDKNLLIDTCTLIGQRLSEKTLDYEMANMLKYLYQDQFDGYIQPIRIASCWMNEFLPEVCLFKLDGIVSSNNVSKIGAGKLRGGSSDDINDVWYYKMNDLMMSLDDDFMHYNNMVKLMLRYDGYSVIEINTLDVKDGYIQIPSAKEREQKRKTSKDFPDEKEVREMDKWFSNEKIQIGNGVNSIVLKK